MILIYIFMSTFLSVIDLIRGYKLSIDTRMRREYQVGRPGGYPSGAGADVFSTEKVK